jgi:hypothetical protein
MQDKKAKNVFMDEWNFARGKPHLMGGDSLGYSDKKTFTT